MNPECRGVTLRRRENQRVQLGGGKLKGTTSKAERIRDEEIAMRVLALAACTVALFQLSPITKAQALAAKDDPPNHPGEVAFVDEGAKGHVYRKFPTGERLYVSDRDGIVRSVCNDGCASAWPPVYAPADAVAVGDWKVFRRDDGRMQWALKGRPVYTRFHDSSEVATGDGIDGVWHLIGYTRVPTPPAQ